MKKIASLCLVLLCCFAAKAEARFNVKGLYYEIDDYWKKTVKVTFESEKKSVNYQGLVNAVIPGSVTYNGEEYEVIEIGINAFLGCTSMTSVTIPVSVKQISQSAFEDCSGLTSIDIPDMVTYIGHYAFEGCSNLISVTIPNTVTTIGSHTFSYCSSLTSVHIPNSVTTIGSDAFIWCTNLTSVTLPNSITTIADGVFWGCSSLTSLDIPNTVTSIGDRAFISSGLTSVTIPTSVTTIENNAFLGFAGKFTYDGNATGSPWGAIILNGIVDGDFVFADEEKTKLVAYRGKEKIVTIPNTVDEIDYTFDKRKHALIYSGSATGSPWGACIVNGTVDGDFVYADKEKTRLVLYVGNEKEVTIPNTVTTIGDNAFRGCTNLTSVTIPNSVTTIGEAAFSDCSNLTSVTIPSSVTTIGSNAFQYCGKLREITIPNSVTEIGSFAFYMCSNLTSVTIPSSVTTIGPRAFTYCSNLTSVDIPNSVTSIEESAFFSSGLTSVTIPALVTTIGDNAFAFCSNLTSVTIPASVTTIGGNAFAYCPKLTSVDIPNSVTSIEESAFFGSGLTSVTIPASVTSIGKEAFICENIKIIRCKATEPVSLESDVFSGVKALVDVPCGSMENYVSEWGKEYSGLTFNEVFTYDFKVDVNYPSMGKAEIVNLPECGKEAKVKATANKGAQFVIWSNGDTHEEAEIHSINYNLTMTACFAPANVNVVRMPGCDSYYYYDEEEKTLYIFGYGYCDLGVYQNKGGWGDLPITEVEYVEIENVKSIDDATFHGFTALKAVTLPETLKSLGSHVFNNCENLESVIIPQGVTAIEYAAFAGNTNLKEITIPSSVTSISTSAFNQCSSLNRIICKNPTPINVYSGAFIGTISSKVNVIVPCGSSTAYSEAEGWRITGFKFSEGFIYDFMAISNNNLTGTVSISQMPSCDKPAIFEAKPAENYHFVKWSDGSTEAKREVLLTDDLIVRAYFELGTQTSSTYTVNVSAVNGTVEGAGQYEKGTNVILTAIPDNGYHFVKWNDGVLYNPRMITVDKDFDLTPVFSLGDGIKDIMIDKSIIEGVYDLMGRKLKAPQKGINIINGKKTIVK